MPPLNRPTRAIGAARAFRKDDQRRDAADQTRHLFDDAARRVLPIDEQVAGALQVPAEKRETAERVLGDDSKLTAGATRRGSGCRRCSDGSRRRHTRVRLESLEPLDRDAHARRPQDQPRPRARAPMAEVATAIEERRNDRERPEHDRVDADGGNEKEDRPPPVIGRDHNRQWCDAEWAIRPAITVAFLPALGAPLRPAAGTAAAWVTPAPSACRSRCSGRRSSCRPSSAARW